MFALAAGGALLGAGCSQRNRESCPPPAHQPLRVVAVAPVLNLSNSSEVDAVQITDMVASELASSQAVSVIPVNISLAALARRGKSRIESPAEARALAEELGADAAVVMALVDLDPYDPPRVGLVMQWYDQSGWEGRADAQAPQAQLQRVFDASDEDVIEDVKRFADDRDRHRSPYKWRRNVVSQQLFLRYCIWSTIRTMLSQKGLHPVTARAHGNES
jgi:hypothetical protein